MILKSQLLGFVMALEYTIWRSPQVPAAAVISLPIRKGRLYWDALHPQIKGPQD